MKGGWQREGRRGEEKIKDTKQEDISRSSYYCFAEAERNTSLSLSLALSLSVTCLCHPLLCFLVSLRVPSLFLSFSFLLFTIYFLFTIL
jgi:hypothetical protein